MHTTPVCLKVGGAHVLIKTQFYAMSRQPALVAKQTRSIADWVFQSQEVFETHKAKLLGLDRYFFIDQAFIAHLAGDGGQAALEERFLQTCVPSSEVLLGLLFCVQKSKEFRESVLYQLSNTGAQGSIDGAHQLLNKIEQGLAITLDDKATEFTQKVFARIQHFVVHTEKGEIKYDDSGKLAQSEDLGAITLGADALKKIWQQIKDQEANALSLKILEPCVVYDKRGFRRDVRRTGFRRALVLQKLLAPKARNAKLQVLRQKTLPPKQLSHSSASLRVSVRASAELCAMSLPPAT